MNAAGIRWLETADSTQDLAHEMAAAGAPHGAAVAARIQSAGRGTRGRQWESPPGGLWLSVVCRTEPVGAVEAVSLRVGLALAGLVERLVVPGTSVAIRWPNDLMIDDRKAGGVLAEARWQGDSLGWLVVGIGLNVRNEIPESLRAVATRLADHGVRATAEELAPAVVERIAEAARAGVPLMPEEVAALRARDWLLGRELALPRGGIAAGIAPDGRLRIRGADGSVTETVGSVRLAGAKR